MADKNWGIKIFCECGTKYYSMNKSNKILCPVCSSEYVPEDLNIKQSFAPNVKLEPKKKLEELDSFDETSDDDSDDIISLDDQKDIEESNEDIKND